jgi:hypothetical protein
MLTKDQFLKITNELGELLATKNEAYGNAFEKTTKILELLYPNGISVSQYKDVHVIVRMLDKMSRIARDNDPMGEDPFKDIAGYAILAQLLRSDK